MRAMSVPGRAKSNRHRKAHWVEPGGTGRKFMHLARVIRGLPMQGEERGLRPAPRSFSKPLTIGRSPATGSSYLGKQRPSRGPAGEGSLVQPPDAENRMPGGVEGSRGAIPATPSDPGAAAPCWIAGLPTRVCQPTRQGGTASRRSAEPRAKARRNRPDDRRDAGLTFAACRRAAGGVPWRPRCLSSYCPPCPVPFRREPRPEARAGADFV